MDNAKQMKTPMHTTTVLGLDDESKKMEEKTYKGMIRSLLYLTTSRPDIMFSVCLCAKFQKKPREVHLSAVKHIFRYLIGTLNLCNIPSFHVCVVDSVIALSCNWVVVLDY